MRFSSRELLIGLGGLVVLYAITLLEFVAISPDLRIRSFLVDPPGSAEGGIVIRQTPGLKSKQGQAAPQPGDVLLNVVWQPTPTLLDFFDAKDRLYDPDEKQIDRVNVTDQPSDWSSFKVSGLVQEFDASGPRRRLAEVIYRSFQKDADGRVETCWVEIQSAPPLELALSLLWLIPHLGILLVGGAAFWQRPFDRAARLFYVMCIVTMGSYLGGFHWWTVANSAWLTFPFIACGVLLPTVTLHFFLVFPRPIGWALHRPRTLLVLLYTLPVLAILGGAAFLMYARLWAPSGESALDPDAIANKVAALSALRTSINAYLVIASTYYAFTLAALIRSSLTVREPLERAQVRWILWAALFATLPVGYTIWLAATDRAAFAFGEAKIPMFFASFGFLLAYAVGMARHRLLLIDEVIGKGIRYYAARVGLTALVAAALAALGLWAGAWDAWLPQPQSRVAVIAVIVLAVALLLFARDRIQEELDRRFFSEKYQLGAALRGVHVSTEVQNDEFELGRRVVDSCRQALDVARVAVYRRSIAGGGEHRLAASAGGGFPDELQLDESMTAALAEEGSIQRVLAGSRAEVSAPQELLRRLSAQLLYVPPSGDSATTLLVLGSKENDASFTAEDLTFLSALGHVADVALGAGVHRRLAEQLRLATEQLQRAEEAAAGQSRQIAVLQGELTDLYVRQGTAPQLLLEGEFRREIIRGDSPAMNAVLDTVRKVASSDATVMIRGESGTGKELLAQVVHENSPRRDGPLIKVHCAALSPTLLESELFGHVKGAFTGADRDKIGRFHLADRGTLFLDEIGEISPETQVKLLRVLQERSFEPVGSSQTVQVDVRLITATNRNLEQMMEAGEFREDLFYRLNVVSVTLPALRERVGDVYDLAFTFLHRAARRFGKVVTRIDDAALAVLTRYHWPGNVRELQNVIERAVVLTDGEAITLADLPAELAPLREAGSQGKRAAAASAKPAISRNEERTPRRIAGPVAASAKPANRVATALADTSEREQLVAALRNAHGNKAEAARALGLPRSTFFSKLKKHDLS
jgi:transcriptional regulator with GAF, ATPase, and Fis domain